MTTAATHDLKVIEQIRIADGVYYLSTERPFRFTAGQCVALSIESDEEPRFYSIASGEAEDQLSILYDVVPEGRLTPRLASLRTGDRIRVSDPFGSFTDTPGRSVWIATGTGIAPFLSAARSAPCTEKSLMYGARTAERFYFAAELAERLDHRADLCCSQCAGGESTEVPILVGRLTERLREASARGVVEPGARYMLCGSAGMIVEVRDILISAGVPFDRILSEIYF